MIRKIFLKSIIIIVNIDNNIFNMMQLDIIILISIKSSFKQKSSFSIK